MPSTTPRHALTASVALVALTALDSSAHAQHVRVRSLSAGRLTHFARSDRSTAAPRLLSQSLELDAYDLSGDGSGALSARLNVRYHTDIGLPTRLRDEPLFQDFYNDPRLDVAQVRWRPSRTWELRAGRIWSWSALGARDFDGLAVAARPSFGDQHMHLELYAGRRAALAYGWYASSTFDVQGLPVLDDPGGADDAPLLVGASASYRWSDVLAASVALQQTRGEDTISDARAAGALSVTPLDSLSLSTQATYHFLLQDLTRAGAQVSWRAPSPGGDLSAGVERRRPWFDSSSIFNVFGANPYDAAYLDYAQPLASRRVRLGARLWARAFHGDDDLADAGTGERDALAVGGALDAHARIDLAGSPTRWRARASYQRGRAGYDGDQALVDLGARAPFSLGELFWLRARVVGAWTSSGSSTRADGDVFALSGVVGADIPALDVGTLSLLVEQQLSTAQQPMTNLFFNLSVEVWP